MVQVQGKDSVMTTKLEKRIQNIAHQFGIDEKTVRINDDYLGANYVDPALVPAIAVIMLIIVAAGIITIYSIYYVSMNQRVQEFGRLKAIGETAASADCIAGRILGCRYSDTNRSAFGNGGGYGYIIEHGQCRAGRGGLSNCFAGTFGK